MSAARTYVLALVAVVAMALTATAQSKLYNPIARSFGPQAPRVIHISALLQQDESPASAADEAANPFGNGTQEVDENGSESKKRDDVPDDTGETADTNENGNDNAAESASDVAVPADEDDDTETDENSTESASDVPMPELLDEPEVPLADSYYSTDDCCCGGRGIGLGGLCRCQHGKPWNLPQPCAMQRLGIKVGGWIQQGITTNNNNPTDNYNATVAISDRDGEWLVNQMWLYITRPIKQRDCCWQVGGHVDIVYGSDWRYGRFFGLEERINGDNNFYGWVFPQFYLEVGGHNLSIKMGHMAGPLGYEIVPSVANFFYSHSYAMNYTEPQLVTGLWADYKIGDNWTVQAGFHRGFFMFEDLDNNLDFMGGIQWTSCDKKTSLRYAVSIGNDEGLFGQTWFASSLVFQHQFTEKLKYVLQHNLGTINDVNIGPIGDAEWYGLNQYLFYTINKCWKAGMRVEWLRDDDGSRVAGVANLGTPGNFVNRGWIGGPGYAGDFWEVSLGMNWSPHPNVRVRPELRWDWYEGPNNLLKPLQPRPFDDFLGDDQLTAAVDILLTF